MAQPVLSVVIPMWNEEHRIGATLQKVDTYLTQRGLAAEVLVIDDGSTDQSIQTVRNLPLKNPVQVIAQTPNQGKGSAVRRGALAAKGQYILFMDADNSTDLKEWDAFAKEFAQGYDVVIGSRYVPGARVLVKQPWYRIALARCANLLIQITLLPGIHDTQCGFKAFTYQAAQKVFPKQRIQRWGFDFEILYIARAAKLKIKEAPVERSADHNTRIKFVRDSLRTLTELARIRWNAWMGRYKSTT